MAKTTGFKEYTRELPAKRPPASRVRDFNELEERFPDEKITRQAARCMDCGVPFCNIGCPLGNIIPDWNDLVYRGQWKEALRRLHATNNFPEFTGRLCPAPCEEACVLAIAEPAVTIEFIEKTIAERGFAQGWIKPVAPVVRTAKTVAVIGSGPAGLACAQQLNRAGHTVTVFEKDDRIGGLLRYGIPNFKMEKWVLDRRLEILKQEGVIFKTNSYIGRNVSVEELKTSDAIVVCIGSVVPRDLPIPGRDLDGIHYAMDFLTRQNRICEGDSLDAVAMHSISAEGKDVIVIGGGDTGSDCIGTANRQGARSVTNFELLPKPPRERPEHQPWPYWPMRMRTSSSHEEGCDRNWSILTKEFIGEQGKVTGLITVTVEFIRGDNGAMPVMREIPGTEKEWRAHLVLLALGFTGPERNGLVENLQLALDARGNVKTDSNYLSSVPGVFSAGDARRGQSLIVWAISEGREAARHVDRYLMGETQLPTKGNTTELPLL
jgi:glutamate synthase (NADPH/NADH) small chain